MVFNLFRLEIVPTLLHVFVDIEATGQAVQFEMKFSYRRPMVNYFKNLIFTLAETKFFIFVFL